MLSDYDKGIFNPAFLLGVETNKGFIVDLDNRGALFVGKTWYHPNGVRYYISDDSDETVSFEEYVELFYEK